MASVALKIYDIVLCGRRGTRDVLLCGQRGTPYGSCPFLWPGSRVVFDMFHMVSWCQRGTGDVTCGFVWPAW